MFKTGGGKNMFLSWLLAQDKVGLLFGTLSQKPQQNPSKICGRCNYTINGRAGKTKIKGTRVVGDSTF
jgi:hypothetical protein